MYEPVNTFFFDDRTLAIVSFLLIAVSLLVIRLQNLLAAIFALGVLSLLSALAFYIMRAPDVSITEAAVNAALGTAIYLIALNGVSRKGAGKVEQKR